MKIWPTILVASNDISSEQKAPANYICDGSGDHVEINQALSYAESLQGAIVMLSRGNFNISNTLKIGNKTILTGQGISSIINVSNSLNKMVITNKADYTPGTRHATGNNFVALRDFHIEGNKYNQGAGADAIQCVAFNTVEHLTIENLFINEPWVAGIRTEFCTYFKILKNTVKDSGDDGIAVNEESFYGLVSNNIVIDTGQGGKSFGFPEGIEVQDGSHHVSVLNNIVRNAQNCAIAVNSHSGKPLCYNVAVANNLTKDSSYAVYIVGIYGSPCWNIIVTNNSDERLDFIDKPRFVFGSVMDSVLSSNTSKSPNYPFSLEGTTFRNLITNNTFVNPDSSPNGRTGVRLTGTMEDIRFQNNLIENYGWKGIRIYGPAKRLFIVDNNVLRCSHASGHCIDFDNYAYTDCVLTDNSLNGTYWSYDVATATYNVLASGWWQDWNKHTT